MAKKFGFDPFILMSDPTQDPMNPVVTGGGSGQGGVTPPTGPMNYSSWLNSEWAEDIIEDGSINEYDYGTWWDSWGFSKELWEELNPDLDWDEYVGG